MKTGLCRCESRIFFGNSRCLACGATVGRCDRCKTLTSLTETDDALDCDECQSTMHRCSNHGDRVCNAFSSEPGTLCRWCRFTIEIPDLRLSTNVDRWALLEFAKRRLLLDLEDLGLPPYRGDLQSSYPLRFKFIADARGADGAVEPVMTGHDSGVITINLREADSVQRERMRVELGEPQRTLIGHLRHEVGHYIDWSLADRFAADESHRHFGDPASIDYTQAMQDYYERGAPAGWEQHFVSRYATMHPWEDFAETANAYLDIMAIAATANDQGLSRIDLSPGADSDEIVLSVLEIVVAVSEFNSDLGLSPLLPEKLPRPVMRKLSFIHSLRSLPLPDRPAAR